MTAAIGTAGSFRRLRSDERFGSAVSTICGVAVLLGAWVLAGVLLGASRGVPSPAAVGSWAIGARTQIASNAITTSSHAGRGYLIGTGLAIAAAIGAFTFRRLERSLVSLAVMSYCLPLVALAPLLRVTLSGDASQVTLAALCVFFTTMLGVLTGLRNAPRATLDVVRSIGGNRWTELRLVRLQSAFGPTLAALTLAAPLSVLGAILGEFLGAESGLGVALVNAQKTGDPARAWAYCLTTVAIAGFATLLMGTAARVLAPWHRTTSRL
jgi:ABC-type nitrate/sulfonate/bicarbonate transport system permease component